MDSIPQMMVFGHSHGGGSGSFLTGKQVFPVDCEAEVSHRLLEASHTNDLRLALECIANPFVDAVVTEKSLIIEKFLETESI
ncbi:hypothetical protein Vadar_011735 [Vaccinium darrowii]|uniref:Uncharacterized protein n=1 Tax=Vaccinium darrowii TaxID=229202 RepID=A0ACB7X0A3_9ERIC|nr:hypothetical protein Vadar_011735 [Vaccinium darrowii]